jgi:hypothetical protein
MDDDRGESTAGDFGWRCVAGETPFDAGTYLTDALYGLPQSQTFVYGSVRDPDGAIWTPMRRFAAGDGGKERFLLQTSFERDHIGIHAAGAASARSLGVQRSIADGALVLDSAADDERAPFRITASSESFAWTESGSIDLSGRPVLPSLHWHLPDRTDGMYYLSQLMEVSGTILDRPVRGFIGVDQMWMDGFVYVDDVFVGHQAEILWYTWATRYQDGTFDGGHFMVGHGGLGFAITYDETGAVNVTSDIDGIVTLDGDGPWPTRIDVVAAGEQWEFLPDPAGRMTDLMPIPNPQIEGRWRRVGDEREPAHWFAWGEIAPGHGTSRRSR